MLDYSVIIPVYNEEGNIAELDKQIRASMDKLSKNYEVIYVNDGSKDNSLTELKKLNKVKIINLNKNYGQATALDAGFKECKGELVVSLDADLQNDPKDIAKLVKKLKSEGLDVVAGYRQKREDALIIRILTCISRFLRGLLIKDKIHDTGCTLRVYKKLAVKSLNLQGEMHRYVTTLLAWKGFRIGEEKVTHHSRIHGKSKYNCTKCVRGFIDLLYLWFIGKYYQRPLHFFGYASFISVFLGILSGSVALYQKLFDNLGFNRNGWFFLGFFFIIMGVMLFSFGIIIDLLIKINFNSSTVEKKYYIREIIQK
ncbi:MAG: glycosyltransferase family 2 protein [Candidatus Nanoarchaeia archaeon]|jgi:glycosyltransferase involved in cell wall biosynthesis